MSETTWTDIGGHNYRTPGESAADRTSQWFDTEGADEAYRDAKGVAIGTAQAEAHYNNQSRALAKAVYVFVTEVMPLERLKQFKRLWKDTDDREDDNILPGEVIAYFTAKDIQPPHMRAANPFLGVYQHFLNEAKIAGKQMSGPQADAEEKLANDVAAQRAHRAAQQQATRYALLVLAAVDMCDTTEAGIVLIETWSIGKLLSEYPKWRAKNPTLAAKYKAEPSERTVQRRAEKQAEDTAVDRDEIIKTVLSSEDPTADTEAMEGFGDSDFGAAATSQDAPAAAAPQEQATAAPVAPPHERPTSAPVVQSEPVASEPTAPTDNPANEPMFMFGSGAFEPAIQTPIKLNPKMRKALSFEKKGKALLQVEIDDDGNMTIVKVQLLNQ